MHDHVATDAGAPVELSDELFGLVAGGGGHWDPNGVTSKPGSTGYGLGLDPDG